MLGSLVLHADLIPVTAHDAFGWGQMYLDSDWEFTLLCTCGLLFLANPWQVQRMPMRACEFFSRKVDQLTRFRQLGHLQF